MDYGYVFLILLLPFLSFLILGLAGMKLSHKVAGLIGTTSLGAVTVLSYITAFNYFATARVDGAYETIVPFNFTWLPLGDLNFDLGFMIDPISAMMLIVISTVSLMVHIYSFGYMHGEKGFQRYYAFLSLFTMSMLGLVVATNIFQMYLFWELVGVSSYLLIGFYYPLHAAVAASKKAFIVTRFADMFFLIGILIFGYYTGSFSFSFIEHLQLAEGAAPFIPVDTAKAVAAGGFILPTALVLMFIGGAGKSAMFPLHIWLPDAMEGPTPVSALIHAATMVVAGVFQIARLFPLWIEFAPGQMSIVVWVGVFTAFYAAAVACAQSDIKRVLAFSTISQIAFMMVALGVCLPGHHEAIDEHGSLGYMASMFHLFTHAMFKACLFLGAGCIIHAVHSNEMSAMGGLRKYMPVTHITFLISCLAIAGIPFFSGFSSKDEIITACFAYSPVVGWIMTGVAAMTAFYMFRLYYGIFWGTENKELHAHHTPHEAPLTMTLPLIVLCVITVGVGIYTTLAGFLGWGGSFGSFVTANGEDYTIHFDMQVAATSTIIAILSICLATYIYKGETQPIADRLYKMFPRLHRAAYKRFYMDEVYMFVTHKIIFRCISTPIAWFDRHVIDGTFDFLAWGTDEAGESIRSWQSGDVRHYAVWFLTGAVALVLFCICL
ncbi:MAG: NADH-quinone oxidoreductase subunit L [Bacteroidales bacterium]|nr:NADH-quinone oxidoreductase subunit L [Bacteroidales bacterium]MDD6897802.1 NADH-quinone oxidoreductase subunit L [Bacteroidales bacterium]MDY2693745.1 NADH-quinone oxidoreductase subunit L [Prevotella sp.]MDY4731347.1 NADH-quinone oxidoreductase subunit L [Prevotella sp.]MDY6028244.1 NADH-quinone oxidoreductase subunit L [Prevotella sp.]